MNQIILDVETQKAFSQVEGYHPERLGISFVGVIERSQPFSSGTEHSFFETDLDKLWPMLEQADLVIGFNIVGFDFPVLNSYYAGDINQLPVLDLLDRVKAQAGHRVSLDSIATQTLGTQKSGSGLDALKYYEQGRLDELAKYCLDDVRITRDIYDFGLKHQQVKYLNKWNRPIELSVDFNFQPQPDNIVQMTLV